MPTFGFVRRFRVAITAALTCAFVFVALTAPVSAAPAQENVCNSYTPNDLVVSATTVEPAMTIVIEGYAGSSEDVHITLVSRESSSPAISLGVAKSAEHGFFARTVVLPNVLHESTYAIQRTSESCVAPQSVHVKVRGVHESRNSPVAPNQPVQQPRPTTEPARPGAVSNTPVAVTGVSANIPVKLALMLIGVGSLITLRVRRVRSLV